MNYELKDKITITKEFLDAHKDIHKLSAKEFSIIAHKAGLFIVCAHPFRDMNRSPAPELADAIEVYNSNPRHENNTHLAEELVRSTGLPFTAGSDTHRAEDVALSGIITQTEIKTVDDYIRIVKAREVEIIKNVSV